MLENNGQPSSNDRLNPGDPIVSEFTNHKKDPLKIPVSITSEPLIEEVRVFFSIHTTGNYDGYEIHPKEYLTFSGNHLTDTIIIRFNKRWNHNEENSISIQLTGVSDPDITIGLPGSIDRFDKMDIKLEKMLLRYQLPAQSLMEFNGQIGERIAVDILFPNGFFPYEIEGQNLLNIEQADFDFSLEQQPIEPESNKITYLVTITEDLNKDVFSHYARLKLNQLENYILGGNSTIMLVRPERVERDNSLNIASAFYNLADPFHRTYGENWMDSNADGICQWQSFNSFTFPVIVGADHPNAILYDDKGTSDPGDDIYHHAFRIGFNSTNVGLTINSFNLKRWFNNEANGSDVSPGFNIQQALEFYPANGTDSSEGEVRVIPQEILISALDGKQYTIFIEGEGNYEQISNGIYKLDFELRATNDALFNGIQTAKYIMYNVSDYPQPGIPSDECFMPVDL